MSKHGIWFDLFDHLKIHDEVIDQYSWLVASGDTGYTIDKVQNGKSYDIYHSISFQTTNNCNIRIDKTTATTDEAAPTHGLTTSFSYNCIKQDRTYELMYHSAHSRRYNPLAPWHTKPHKHEFDGKIQRIHIYSEEHRPLSERGRKYTWKNFPVEMKFLGNSDWPFVSEFLNEVSKL